MMALTYFLTLFPPLPCSLVLELLTDVGIREDGAAIPVITMLTYCIGQKRRPYSIPFELDIAFAPQRRPSPPLSPSL